MYRYINSQKSLNNTILKLVILDKEIKNPFKISNFFNTYFHSVFEKPFKLRKKSVFSENLNIIGHATNCFNATTESGENVFDTEFIKYVLHKTKTKSFRGPDDIPSSFYCKLSDLLAPLIAKLFNKFYKFSYIPEEWKLFIVTPLYKKQGSKFECKNYRPITSSSALLRIFENSIKTKLLEVVGSNLSEQQHGFLKTRSTLSNLLSGYNFVYKTINQNQPVDMISFDFLKAFDKVPYDILIDKLKQFNINRQMINIISELLRGRVQSVTIGNSFSDKMEITRGVSQGSPLSPMLFIIFIK